MSDERALVENVNGLPHHHVDSFVLLDMFWIRHFTKLHFFGAWTRNLLLVGAWDELRAPFRASRHRRRPAEKTTVRGPIIPVCAMNFLRLVTLASWYANHDIAKSKLFY